MRKTRFSAKIKGYKTLMTILSPQEEPKEIRENPQASPDQETGNNLEVSSLEAETKTQILSLLDDNEQTPKTSLSEEEFQRIRTLTPILQLIFFSKYLSEKRADLKILESISSEKISPEEKARKAIEEIPVLKTTLSSPKIKDKDREEINEVLIKYFNSLVLKESLMDSKSAKTQEFIKSLIKSEFKVDFEGKFEVHEGFWTNNSTLVVVDDDTWQKMVFEELKNGIDLTGLTSAIEPNIVFISETKFNALHKDYLNYYLLWHEETHSAMALVNYRKNTREKTEKNLEDIIREIDEGEITKELMEKMLNQKVRQLYDQMLEEILAYSTDQFLEKTAKHTWSKIESSYILPVETKLKDLILKLHSENIFDENEKNEVMNFFETKMRIAKKTMIKATEIAYGLRNAKIQGYLQMLLLTPIQKWGQLFERLKKENPNKRIEKDTISETNLQE